MYFSFTRLLYSIAFLLCGATFCCCIGDVKADVSVSITPSSAQLCPSVPQTFMATPLASNCEAKPPATYQWYVDGAAISGATKNTYTTSFMYFNSHTSPIGDVHVISCVVSVFACGSGTGQTTATIVPSNLTISYATATPPTSTTCIPIQFNVASTDCPSATVVYTWNFQDGTSPVNGQSVSHTFSANGVTLPTTYNVTVIAADGTNTVSQTVSINLTACNCLTKTIDLQSEIGGGDASSNHMANIANNGSHPVAFCAVLRDNNGKPVANQLVRFNLEENPAGWTVSPTSATTNGKGQAVTNISCSNAAVNSTLDASVTCTGNAVTSSPITLYPASPPTFSTTADPTFFGFGYDTPGAITWYSNSEFGGQIQSALQSWQGASAKIKFTQGTSTSNKLYFYDVRSAGAGWSGLTNLNLNSAGDKITGVTIEFNLYILDGDPTDPNAPSDYPPASAQHAIPGVACHEVGHALGLAHNGSAHNALMYPYYGDTWFLCGTNTPQTNETQAIATLYP